MPSFKSRGDFMAKGDLDPTEVQKMLNNLDMKKVKSSMKNANVDVDQLQETIKNIDLKKLTQIINAVNSMQKLKSKSQNHHK